MRHPSGVDEAIARFDEVVARYDGRTPEAVAARRRHHGRNAAAVGRRVATGAMAIGALIVATIVFGLIIGPIGQAGLFIVALAILAVIVIASLWPSRQATRVPYSEQLPTKAVVQQLESLLVGERAALPPPAAREVDAISAQLPLLESKLATLDPLDPLAQDARRLMGQHLPELIERYERVPAPYRRERDNGGLTVDERLAASLRAASVALGEIGTKLVGQDRDAFETQGRFIESRYKDPSGLEGS
ncbi:MAG TPA: hypothetical protein VF552_06525 [Allosphingosinicella sp.]|jgi:hypothetical protein